MPNVSPRRAFLVILAAYLALALAWSVIVPLAEAPDEADHYAYIVYLGQNHSLPQGTTVTQSKHPPLYHAAAAALTAWTGQDFSFLRANPDALPLGPGQPPNLFVHTALEDFPWRDGALAMHLARLFSIALGAVTVWAAWRLGMEVFPQRPAVGLIAAAFMACLPGFLFISASVNNDNAAALFGALAVLVCAATLRRGLAWQRSLALGICLGLGLLSKVGTLALWPLALLAVGGAWWMEADRRAALARAVGHGVLIGGLALLLASPWLLRNWQLYGDPLAWDLVRATIDQRLEPLRLADLGWLLRGFHRTFWGRFGGAGQVELPRWAQWTAALFSAALAVGAIRFVAQLARTRRGLPAADRTPLLWLHLALLAAAPALMLLSIVRYSAIALGTDQARLMFPALSALSVWVGIGVLGLAGGARKKDRDRAVTATFAGGMAVFALATLLVVVRPAFAPPAPLQPAGSMAQEALARFAGLELVGVQLPDTPTPVGEPVRVRLLWRAGAPMPDDLRPALRLVHQDGWLAAEWSRSPAQGRHSTDHWQEGEVYADDYRLLPDPGPPGVYTVEVGVRPLGGDWIPVAGPNGGGPFLSLGQIRVQD